MAVPTIQSRVAAMGQQASNNLPGQPPAFLSTQNLKNFGSDLWGGAGYGAEGALVGSAAGGAYNAAFAPSKVAQIAQPAGQPPAMSPALQQTNNAFNKSQNPSFLGALGGNLKQAIPKIQEAGKFFGQFAPPTQTRQTQMQPFAQQVPQAQSGPSILSNNTSGQSSPYFSFEKFFSSQAQMRPLIGDATGMPQNASEDDPTQVRQQQQEQQAQQEEQWGAPESGFGKYAYNVTDWLYNSPWAHRIVGAGAGLAAAVSSYGTLAAASPLIGTAAGAAFKGLTGQLRNFFAAKQGLPQQQGNPMQGQPSILNNQPQMGIA